MKLSRTGVSLGLLSAFVAVLAACATAARPGFDESEVLPQRAADAMPDGPGTFGEGGTGEAGPIVDPSTDPGERDLHRRQRVRVRVG